MIDLWTSQAYGQLVAEDDEDDRWRAVVNVLPAQDEDGAWATVLRLASQASVEELLQLRLSSYSPPLVAELWRRVADEVADRVEELWENTHSDNPPPPTGVESVVCIPCRKGIQHAWHDDGILNREGWM